MNSERHSRRASRADRRRQDNNMRCEGAHGMPARHTHLCWCWEAFMAFVGSSQGHLGVISWMGKFRSRRKSVLTC